MIFLAELSVEAVDTDGETDTYHGVFRGQSLEDLLIDLSDCIHLLYRRAERDGCVPSGWQTNVPLFVVYDALSGTSYGSDWASDTFGADTMLDDYSLAEFGISGNRFNLQFTRPTQGGDQSV